MYLCPCGAEWAGKGYESYGLLSGKCDCVECEASVQEALDTRALYGTTHGVLCEECDALLTEEDRMENSSYREEWDNERYVCKACMDHTQRKLGITSNGGW